MKSNKKRQVLAKKIVKEARVIDAQSGFIFCEEINHLVAPSILKEAAEIVNDIFLSKLPKRLIPEKVLGIPNRGKEFAVALGMETGFKIGVTERLEVHGDDKKDIETVYDADQDTITIKGIKSFTKSRKIFNHIIRGIEPGDKVLVADDFCATGHATEHYMKAFKQLGITPVFVYLVAKDFPDTNPVQIGYRNFIKSGIPVFSVVCFTEIVGDKVIVTTEDNIFS